MQRKTIIPVALTALILLSGCSSILPGGGEAESLTVNNVAGPTADSLSDTESVAYTWETTIQNESTDSEMVVMDGNGTVAGIGSSSTEARGLFSYDGTIVEQGPPILYYRNETVRYIGNTQPNQSQNRTRWVGRNASKYTREQTQLGVHEAILRNATNSTATVQRVDGETALLTVKVSSERLTQLYNTVPLTEPGAASFPEGPETVNISYRINTDTDQLKSVHYQQNRIILAPQGEARAAVKMTANYTRYDSASANRPENLTKAPVFPARE